MAYLLRVVACIKAAARPERLWAPCQAQAPTANVTYVYRLSYVLKLT